MTTFGWSYKKGKRPTADSAADPPLSVPSDDGGLYRKRLHPQNHNAESAADGADFTKKVHVPLAAKLFVGGFDMTVDESKLGKYFEVFGSVVEVKIVRDQYTNISRGFGFVSFSNAEEAMKAKKWAVQQLATLNGRKITVDHATRRKTREEYEELMRERMEKQRHLEKKHGEIQWEYKWEEKEDAEIYGPFPTLQMLEWSGQFFKDQKVWVRQADDDDDATDKEWSLASEIDFGMFP